MEIFENKVKFNPQRINRLLVQQIGKNLNEMSEPCHKVSTKAFENTLYREMGVQTRDLSEFAKRTYKGVMVGMTFKVPFTVLITYIYHKALKTNQKQLAQNAIMYLLIKFYGSETDKSYPKFCVPEVFRYTLTDITPVHLFRREKTIGNAIIYLAKALDSKYSSAMVRWDPMILKDFSAQSRRRIAQSVQSFAEQYYKNEEMGKGTHTEKDATSEEDEEKKNMFQTTTAATGKISAVEKFLKSMFVYKSYDRKAVDEAKRLSRIKSNIAESIIPFIHEKESEEQIKIIMVSFLKEILDVKSLCGNDFFRVVKKLMMVRNYKDSYVFRNLVVNFTKNLFENANPPNRQLQARDKINLETFVALYLTISFRNLFC